jgi:hypothetical protein
MSVTDLFARVDQPAPGAGHIIGQNMRQRFVECGTAKAAQQDLIKCNRIKYVQHGVPHMQPGHVSHQKKAET